MTVGICVNCVLEIEYDENVTEQEKPRPYWTGMWRARTTGSVECAAENAYTQSLGWPEVTYRMHDPVQQFLVSYHTTGGSMGEAIYAQEQWLVSSRANAESLKEALYREARSAGLDEYLLQITPLGIEVVEPDPDSDWGQVISRFKEQELAGYGEEDE